MRLSLGLGVQERVQSGTLLNQAEVSTYISGLATPLSSVHISKLNKFVREIKTGIGVSALSDVFDILYLIENETSEAAFKNLARDQNHATLVNSPSWVQLQGVSGNGSTSYVDTNYNPTIHGNKFELNNGAIGVFCTNEKGNLDIVDFGARNGSTSGRSFIQTKGSTSALNFNINTTSVTSSPPGSVMSEKGLSIATRTGNNLLGYKNKITLSNTSKVSDVITNQAFYLGCLNNAGVASLFTTRQYSMAFAGRHITEAERDVIYDAFMNYSTVNQELFFLADIEGNLISSDNNFIQV